MGNLQDDSAMEVSVLYIQYRLCGESCFTT